MFKSFRLLSMMVPFFLAGSAFSAATSQLDIQSYEAHPHQQRLQITGVTRLGYPVGDANYGIILDCKASTTGTVQFFRLQNSALFTDGMSVAGAPDAALGKALLASGLITFNGGVLTIKKVDGLNLSSRPLVNSCKSGVLSTELRDGLRDNDSVMGATMSFRVPVASEDSNSNAEVREFEASVAKVLFDADPVKGGFRLTRPGVSPDFLALNHPQLQMLISDGRALYPLFYNGQSQTNAAAKSLLVAGTVSIYVTLDGTSWSRTDLDLKTQRTQTRPATLPKLPIKS